MNLTGDLKKQVDEAADNTEKEKLNEKASIKLTDDELNMVAGGIQNNKRCPYNPGCTALNSPYCTLCVYKK